MVNQKIREYFAELSKEVEEEIYFLDNQAYDNSIIGYTEDYRLIYSYERMVEELSQEYLDSDPELSQSEDELVREEACDNAYTDAIEWIDYNTMALPYLGDRAPIVIHELNKGEFDE